MKAVNFDVKITFYSVTVATYIKRECEKKKEKRKKKNAKKKTKKKDIGTPPKLHMISRPFGFPKSVHISNNGLFSLLGNHLLLYIHLSSDNES